MSTPISASWATPAPHATPSRTLTEPAAQPTFPGPWVPDGLAIHLILDNYGTHKHEKVQRWLRRHKRFHLHFTPTSSSWLNLVERWFRELTDKALRRGSFNSVPTLIEAIEDYMNAHNQNPQPFVWTATVDSILAKVRRGRVALDQVVSQ